MTVEQLVVQFPYIEEIEVRTNSPCDDVADIFYGMCKWDGKELISLDGDDYYLSDDVYKYHAYIDNDNKWHLSYWFKSNWQIRE